MDAIKLAIRNIQNEPKIRKASLTASDIEDAASQLPSSAILLELSSTSANTFTKLNELLRGRLMPLYRITLCLTLDYFVAVFQYVYRHKMMTSKHASQSRRSWEIVLESLFSGLLDFLEENSGSKHREAVGSALYAVLCPLFFCSTESSRLDFDGNLLSTVYQLLMTTVEATPKNAIKLRDSEIGSKRLGITILNMKEFLAMESLLELFALLIPPLKDGRQKRTKFIKEVFAPSIFTCSHRIIGILEDISNPDWSATSVEIVKVLAGSDIMFPQPFEVSRMAFNTIQIETSSFYIDKFKFVANVDKDGKIETLIIPFSTISNIFASALSNNEMRISATLTEPPVLGDKPILELKATGPESRITWQIGQRFDRFADALKNRHLKLLCFHPRRKLSKTEEIALEFQSEEQESMSLRRGKVQSLSQLWAEKTPHSKQSNQTNSTPLVSPDFTTKYKLNIKSAVQVKESGKEVDHGETTFADPDGKLTVESDVKKTLGPNEHQSVQKPIAQDLQDHKSVVQEVEGFEDIPRPKPKTAKPRRRFISLSDDDDGHESSAMQTNSKGVDPLSFSNADPTSYSLEDSPSCDSLSRSEVHLQPTRTVDNSIDDQPPAKKHNKDQAAVRNRRDDEVIGLNHVKGQRKRPFDDESSTSNGIGAPRTKNPRLESDAKQLPGDSPLESKKGPFPDISSPSPCELTFDEVPHTKKELKRSKMKTRNGKLAITNKRGPVKKVEKAADTGPGRNIAKKSPILRQDVETDPDITLVDSKDKPRDSKHVIETPQESLNRRSARVATMQTLKKTVQKATTVVKKSKKAPWEEQDFMQKKDTPSDASPDETQQDRQTRFQTENSPYATPIDKNKNSQPTVEACSSNIAHQIAYTESFHDYTVETKLGSMPSGSPVAKTESEIVMIDLTHDLSPPMPQSSKVSSTDNLKKNLEAKFQLKKMQLETDLTDEAPKPHSANESQPTVVLAEQAVENRKLVPALSHLNVTKPLRSLNDTLHLDVASTGTELATEEMKSVPRPQVPPFSRSKIEKMETYQENPAGNHFQTSPMSKARDTRFENGGIKKMKSFDSVTDDSDSYRRSSVKFHLPDTGNNSPIHNFKHDKVRNRNQTLETDELSRETGQYKNQFLSNQRKTHHRNHKSAIEPVMQPMDKIIDVLNKINDGLINKLSQRFDGVSTELRASQQIILESTARPLKEISNASICHFNDLVDLEAEYTTQCTAIANGVHNFRKCSEQLNQRFKAILIEHNSRSLCKKFPTTLFTEVPEVISNPGLKH